MGDFSEFIVGGKRMLIYTYSTEHLLKKDKVRFYYALKGRDGKSGIVKSMKIDHLGRTVLMVPFSFESEIQEFFRLWNLPFEKRKVIVDSHVDVKSML